MNSTDKLPLVRPLDVMPIMNDDGEPCFALQDALQVAPRTIVLSMPGYFLLSFFDGEHTPRDVQIVCRKQFGQELEIEQIENLIRALDESYLLANERFEAAYEQRCQEYRDAPVRDSRERWPDAEALRGEIEELLSGETSPPDGAPRGLITPHLDYARGGPAYAAAYAALRPALPADRFVILGTNHHGRSTSAVATRKDFLTPLGTVSTDAAFIDEWESRLGASLCEHEPDHALEHSIELQVHLLQVCQPDHPFKIVPVLCPDPCGPSGTAPCDGHGPDLGAMADALGEMLRESDERTIVIAGADLSHVGQRFGEEAPTTDAFLTRVAEHDGALLSKLQKREEERFVELLHELENPTRICSAGCIYTLLRALPEQACRLLKYHQAIDKEAETHVTCAALAVGSF